MLLYAGVEALDDVKSRKILPHFRFKKSTPISLYMIKPLHSAVD